MFFGELPIHHCTECYLAHSIKHPGLTYKKGYLLDDDDITRLEQAGVTHLTVARLEDEDVHEDMAATVFAGSAQGANTTCGEAFTGRVNIYAECSGMLVLDEEAILSANMVDPAITLATLPSFTAVTKGRMIGTAKIIPFAAHRHHLQAACDAVKNSLKIAPYENKRVAVISSSLPHLKPGTIAKTLKALEERLAPSGSVVGTHIEVPHQKETLRKQLQDLRNAPVDCYIIFGASAIVDIHDVIPAALVEAGGRIEHFGMPVDPGNLLLLGMLDGRPVIGAPGCARSPQENGFDWVLNRVLANLPVTAGQIKAMGVGGLLKEIYSRPQPREKQPANDAASKPPAAVILAAGKSRRTGEHNKLLAQVQGVPIIRQVALSAIESHADPVHVVAGEQIDAIKRALQGLPVTVVSNPNAERGLSTSLAVGLSSLPADTNCAVIMLGDMPEIAASHINDLIEGYEPQSGRLIGVASSNGKRGNPVVWDGRFFEELKTLKGDIGGRPLLEKYQEAVYTVEMGRAARLDLDDPSALEAFGAKTGAYSLKKHV
ncbi:NTP transferase domain-containing protein [Pseudovibrio exalbescens]|uniref:NTP transferase domain-containing protein n=1 Tax=Pseudovibrio exalbescens TaxID=197461 RepID=UPI000C9D0AD2|nr:molybdopterin-binding/glycosyltransferase family 2 protein [Pseudovibrio exalbescens]